MRNRLNELAPASITLATQEIVIEPSLAGGFEEMITRVGFERKELLIVCDSRTYEVLGKNIERELVLLNPEILILEGTPTADEKNLGAIRKKSARALLAVGSGTINDLCKYASFIEKIPYAVFPTAPSMNGYLSANASLTLGGFKESLPAHLPKGVFCDLGVIAAAPPRLILSGLGDALCRPTAQADWLLSHLLFRTSYTPFPFELLKPYEQELFAHADKLTAKNPKVIALLLRSLLVSGVGMVIAKGSYPASQGEHLIAHTMEMKHGAKLKETYHGEQIGVTTLTMARIQQEVLSHKLKLTQKPHWEKTISSYFGSALANKVTEASRKKNLFYDRYDQISEHLEENEEGIRDLVHQITLPVKTLENVLVRAGAPTTPKELGWNERDYELAVAHARFIRDRFTFLDMV